MKTQKIKVMIKPRNPLHKHPLMRKGGVHQKTNKELRKQDKQNLKKEWPYQSLFLHSQFC